MRKRQKKTDIFNNLSITLLQIKCAENCTKLQNCKNIYHHFYIFLNSINPRPKP